MIKCNYIPYAGESNPPVGVFHTRALKRSKYTIELSDSE